MIEETFHNASQSKGEAFLQAERDLIGLGEEALPFLDQKILESDPVEGLLARTLRERIQGNEAFQAVLDFFDLTEAETLPTAMREPPVEWVAGKLHLDFGDTVAPLLALHLNKLAGIWPNWKIMGVLLYLAELETAEPADALAAFLVETPSAHYRQYALNALVKLADAPVLARLEEKLSAEQEPPEALVEAVEALRGKFA